MLIDHYIDRILDYLLSSLSGSGGSWRANQRDSGFGLTSALRRGSSRTLLTVLKSTCLALLPSILTLLPLRNKAVRNHPLILLLDCGMLLVVELDKVAFTAHESVAQLRECRHIVAEIRGVAEALVCPLSDRDLVWDLNVAREMNVAHCDFWVAGDLACSSACEFRSL